MSLKTKMTRSEYINYYIRAVLILGFSFLMVKFGGANADTSIAMAIGALTVDGSVGYLSKSLTDKARGIKNDE